MCHIHAWQLQVLGSGIRRCNITIVPSQIVAIAVVAAAATDIAAIVVIVVIVVLQLNDYLN